MTRKTKKELVHVLLRQNKVIFDPFLPPLYLLKLKMMYSHCGYIPYFLKHITAWDQYWGGDEIMKCVFIYVAWLKLAL